MKKINKILVFVLMLVLGVASILAAPMSVFAVGTALVGVSIALAKMPTTGKVNAVVSIPKGTSDGTVAVSVKDPMGNAVTVTEGTDAYTFTPKKQGNYTVQYTATKTGLATTKSKIYTIKIAGSTSTISFDTNTAFILPETIGKDTTLVLPYPYFSESGGEKDDKVATTDSNVKIKVMAPTSPKTEVTLGNVTIGGTKYSTFTPVKDTDGNVVYGTYAIYYTYNDGTVSLSKSYKVSVSSNYSVENQDITFTWSGSLPTSAVLGKEVTLPTPVTVDKNKSSASVKTYTKIEVVYHNGETTKDYTVSDDFKFTPMDEAKSGSYYSIKYKIYTLEQLNLSADDGKTFDEALANATKFLERTYTLSNVTDSVAPTPQVVNAYELNEDGTISDTVATTLKDANVSYLIPSKARTGVEVTIPAIYAVDNYSAYQNLTFERAVIDEDKNYTYLNGTSTAEAVDSTKYTIKKAEKNKDVLITFKQKGTYTIRYRATDASNNTSESSYNIVITDTLADTVAPYITMPTIQSTATEGDTVSFSKPTVVDYAKDHNTSAGSTDNTVIDSNVHTTVQYFEGDWDLTLKTYSEWKAIAGNEAKTEVEYNQQYVQVATQAYLDAKEMKTIELDEDDSTIYSFVVGNGDVTVVVRAEDDAKYAVGNTADNVSFAYRTITVSATESTDTTAPVLVTDLSTVATALATKDYGQNEEVILSDANGFAFTFTDSDGTKDTTGYLTASLSVFDKNSNEISVSGLKFVYDSATGLKVQDGRFVTTVAGNYNIVVTATDLGGNSLIESVQFSVKDTKAPTIEVDNLKTSVERGETYTLPSPVVVDDGVVIVNQATSQVVFVGDSNPSGYTFNNKTLAFTPNEVGTYSFKYYAVDNSGNSVYSDIYTITVTDTVKPVIAIDQDNGGVPATADYVDSNGNVLDVEIPSYSVTGDYKTSSITVTDPDGDELEVRDYVLVEVTETEYNALEEDKRTTKTVSGTTKYYQKDYSVGYYVFTPNQNGVYKVTYKAVDAAGNTATDEYSITVGDCQAPVVTLTDANKPSSSYKIGDTLKIDLSAISIVDTVDGTSTGTSGAKDGKFVVTLVGPNSTTETFTNEDTAYKTYTFTFETAGTYTLTYTAKDKAGNSDPIVYTFEVASDTNDTTFSEQSWGIVLIVVSLALLSGVVIYFVKTKDAPDKLEKSKELAKKKKDDK